jgi:ankyrin repeat protein
MRALLPAFPVPLTELDSERKSPLHHAPIGCGQAAVAARRGANHGQVAEVLLSSGCAVDAQDAHGCTPLHFAAGAGALGMLCTFIKLSARGAAGIDLPDSIGWTPLFWACNNGHGEWCSARHVRKSCKSNQAACAHARMHAAGLRAHFLG